MESPLQNTSSLLVLQVLGIFDEFPAMVNGKDPCYADYKVGHLGSPGESRVFLHMVC